MTNAEKSPKPEIMTCYRTLLSTCAFESFVIPSSFVIRISSLFLLEFGAHRLVEYANYDRTFLNRNETSRSVRHSKLRAGLFLLHCRIYLDLAHLRRQRQYFDFH